MRFILTLCCVIMPVEFPAAGVGSRDIVVIGSKTAAMSYHSSALVGLHYSPKCVCVERVVNFCVLRVTVRMRLSVMLTVFVRIMILCCVTVNLFLPLNQSLPKRTKLNNEYPILQIQKYILLTTQRSGSSWACSMLDWQNSISCGSGSTIDRNTGNRASELLIRYSRIQDEEKRRNITWSRYREDFVKAMLDAQSAAQEEPCITTSSENTALAGSEPSSCVVSGNKTAAVGFKVMYDQIPRQFVGHDGQFARFLKENDIAVLHLVREATALTIASGRNNKEQKGKLHKMHTSNSTEMEAFRAAKPVKWDASFIDQIHELEDKHGYWQKSLVSTPSLRYHHIPYEKLLAVDDRKDQLEQVSAFLFASSSKGGQPVVPVSPKETSLLQLHEPTCSERIANYILLRQKIQGTRTAEACDMLEETFGED